MMIFSLVAMTGLERCCIKSAYLQWLCHSGERPVARGSLVNRLIKEINNHRKSTNIISYILILRCLNCDRYKTHRFVAFVMKCKNCAFI